jgi:hypothetical protein
MTSITTSSNPDNVRNDHVSTPGSIQFLNELTAFGRYPTRPSGLKKLPGGYVYLLVRVTD